MHSKGVTEWFVYKNAARLAMSNVYALDMAAAVRSVSIKGSALLGTGRMLSEDMKTGEIETHDQWLCPLGQGAKMKLNRKADPLTKLMEELQTDPRWMRYIELQDYDFLKWCDGFMERWYCNKNQYMIRYNKQAKMYNLFYREYGNQKLVNIESRGRLIDNRHFLLSCPTYTQGKHNTCLIIRSFASGIEWVKKIATTEEDILSNGEANMFEVAFVIHEASRLSGISIDTIRGMYIDFGGTPMAKLETPKEILAAAQITVRR